MASIEVLAAFMTATITYATVPGPGTIYIAAQAMAHDTKAALRAVLGLHIGGYVIVVSAAAGLTALFAAVPTLYQGMRLFGALYLIWLGVRIIVFQMDINTAKQHLQSRNKQPTTFLQSVFVEILNPTTAVFYMAFLPQFVVPTGTWPVWLQFIILGVVVNLTFTLPDFVAILLAAKMRKAVTISTRGRRIFQWIGGSVLIGLGVRMVTQRN